MACTERQEVHFLRPNTRFNTWFSEKGVDFGIGVAAYGPGDYRFSAEPAYMKSCMRFLSGC